MSIVDHLSTSLGRRDQEPNQELAKKIAAKKDKKAIKELVENLNNKNRNIQGDCIKTLYEIGEVKPELITEYDQVFLDLLHNKNNRMIWGAMHALDCVASCNPKGIYKNLTLILDAADEGSVITRDHGVSILIKLAAKKIYHDKALVLLLDQMKSCPTNQLPMYVERAIEIISGKHKKDFIKVLSSRLGEIDSESKRKRVEKMIKKLQ